MTTSCGRRWPLSSRAALLALLALAGCADLERGPRPVEVDAGDAAASEGGGKVAFAAVRPVLIAGCASCHAAGQQAGNTNFLLGPDAAADYRSARALVDPTNAPASRLLGKGTGQGHGGGAVWREGSFEHATVMAWIQGGALP